MVTFYIETAGGCLDGVCHGKYKVGDGTGVGVHEAEASLRDCHLGYEEGSVGNIGVFGELGKEVGCDVLDASGEWSIPLMPVRGKVLGRGIDDFGPKEVGGFMHGASGEVAHDGGFIGEGLKELVDLSLDFGNDIGEESLGKFW